jgi:hypothetical protein
LLHHALKFIACPGCNEVGYLILNGIARRGAAASGNAAEIGHKIICNPRRKHGVGCGKCFIVLLQNVLKHFIISAENFWEFLRNIAEGMTTITASRAAAIGNVTNRTIHRWRSRFTKQQATIRCILAAICAPPSVKSSNPLVQTIAHLQEAFPSPQCPAAAFQTRFQTSFL